MPDAVGNRRSAHFTNVLHFSFNDNSSTCSSFTNKTPTFSLRRTVRQAICSLPLKGSVRELCVLGHKSSLRTRVEKGKDALNGAAIHLPAWEEQELTRLKRVWLGIQDCITSGNLLSRTFLLTCVGSSKDNFWACLFQISDSQKTDTASYRTDQRTNPKLPTHGGGRGHTGQQDHRGQRREGGGESSRHPRRGPLQYDGGPEVVITYSLALRAGPWEDQEIMADATCLWATVRHNLETQQHERWGS